MAEILQLTVLNMDIVPNILNQILILRMFLSMRNTTNTMTDLRTFSIKYTNNIIMGHLNINSIRNKLELLSFLIVGVNSTGHDLDASFL